MHNNNEHRGRTAIVFPCYNEEKNLSKSAFLQFHLLHPQIHILFVNDGSTDQTQDVLNVLTLQHPEIFTSLMFSKNRGKAEAVRCGLNALLEQNYDIVGFWDSDLAIPLDELPDFLQVFDDHRIQAVTGARVHLVQVQLQRNMFRHVLARTLITVVNLLFRFSMYDTQCGAKLFRASSSLREALKSPFISRWLFDIELLSRLRLAWCSQNIAFQDAVFEQVLRRCIDQEKSTISLTDCALMPVELLRIFLRQKRLEKIMVVA